MRKKKKTKRVDPIDGAGGETQLELVPFCSAVPFTQLAFACSPRSGTDGDSRAKPHLKITCTAHLACLLLGSPSRRGGWCWWCWCWRWWRVRRRSARVRVCVCVCLRERDEGYDVHAKLIAGSTGRDGSGPGLLRVDVASPSVHSAQRERRHTQTQSAADRARDTKDRQGMQTH